MSSQRVDIADLRPGDRVESVFLLDDFQIRPRKDGGSFLTMALRDRTGKISGIMWDNFAHVRNGAICKNDYVKICGDVQSYQDQLQVRVSAIEKVPDEKVSPEDFLPVTPHNLQELEQQFWELVQRISDSDLKTLVLAIFGKEKFWRKFRRAPSAVSMHQAYLGGLLEHTVGVAKNALKLAENYPQANTDILLAGALLHDIGKVVEFSYDKKIGYTDMGRLIGHIPMGFAMIEYEAARLRNFPVNKKIMVQHILLSHHGYLEFGSPKEPQTIEALLVHHADQLDAQVSNVLEASNNSTSPTKWEYRPMFERFMYSGGCEDLNGVELLAELGYAVGARQAKPQRSDVDDTPDDLLTASDGTENSRA